MSPPLQVKISSGLMSFMGATLGLQNIFAPGSGVFFLPGNDKIASFFVGGTAPSGLSRGQRALSSAFGHFLLITSAAKLATVFSGKEGTFLRRNLFLVFGATQSLMALSMFTRFESDARKAGASFLPLVLVCGVDGAILLWDAITRPRPLKPTAKGK